MNYDLHIETIEMNHISISSEDGATRYYDLNNWTLGAAVENYINDEILGLSEC